MEEIVALTQDLIRFKTTQSEPDEIQRCISFIEAYLNKCGAKYRRLDYNRTPSIIVRPENNVAPILLMSHIDVVDGEYWDGPSGRLGKAVAIVRVTLGGESSTVSGPVVGDIASEEYF